MINTKLNSAATKAKKGWHGERYHVVIINIIAPKKPINPRSITKPIIRKNKDMTITSQSTKTVAVDSVGHSVTVKTPVTLAIVKFLTSEPPDIELSVWLSPEIFQK